MYNDKIDYQAKYLKYKNKYLDLQQKIAGGASIDGSLGVTYDVIQQSTESLINKISDVMTFDETGEVSGTKMLETKDKEKIIAEVKALNGELLRVKAVGEQYVAEYRQINQLIYDAITAILSGDKEVQFTAIKDKLLFLESKMEKGINDPHFNLYFLIIEILKSIQDGKLEKAEILELKKIIEDNKKEMKKVKKSFNRTNEKQKDKIKELEAENKAMKDSKKVTNEAINKLLNFFQYKNTKIEQPAYTPVYRPIYRPIFIR